MTRITFGEIRPAAVAALLALALLAAASGALPGAALAQGNSAYHWERLNVRLDIKEGGRLEVEETHVYRFERELDYDPNRSVSLTDLYRSISMTNLDRVSNVGMTRDGAVVDTETAIIGTSPRKATVIRWDPGRIEAPETRTYVLKYSVAGAFSDLGDEHRLHWPALFPGRGAVVKSGSVTLTVPEGSGHLLDGAAAYGAGVRSERDGNRLTLTLLAPLPADDSLAVGLTLAPGTLGITRPDWQSASGSAGSVEADDNPVHAGGVVLVILIAVVWVGIVVGIPVLILTGPSRGDRKRRSPPAKRRNTRRLVGVAVMVTLVGICLFAASRSRRSPRAGSPTTG